MTEATSPAEVVERLEAALAEVEPWDGGRVIQVGLGNYDSKRMDLSLSDLRAAASLIRELTEREKKFAAACRELSIFATHVSGGGSEMFTRIGDEFYADAKLCRDRYDRRMQSVERLIEARSQKRIAELTEALKPFAECAGEWKGEPADLEVEMNAYGRGVQPCLLVDNFRRAAKLVEPQ